MTFSVKTLFASFFVPSHVAERRAGLLHLA